jgi:hypothetical protein
MRFINDEPKTSNAGMECALLTHHAVEWVPFLLYGKPVCWPVKVESLPPGRYRASHMEPGME